MIYCVESGLKYMLLDKWREENPGRIFDGTDEKKKGILTSHNLEKILKELGQQGNFKFSRLETIHKDIADPGTYHQLYRYCIKVQETVRDKEEELEKTLGNIACWIGERV